ncbi:MULTISPECIES: hypothetical protein [Streptomyces]|uniref:hypothetical protein n=1 Tax=Streptomyces TaxID=1883 RepID=UPI000805BF62|nr:MULTISPECIES: hypothetical protein [unclassified Streptomyces]MYQ51472.1 hypothetical protein [Streptomyces sp. SID4941]MYR75730.1 hypothetical protein [Streptomyces sp. SID4925]SBU89123.1 hypothetical protein YUMDRAFT_00538 [Streptomyces sp. OspMP-M45]SCD61810.1 hypothetical protein GA0115247_109314 [Streptomyces sp. PalvLS-984]SCE15990.1 hypothetical protein GA0115249_114416 [Streptomyces sp. PpalLS-921]
MRRPVGIVALFAQREWGPLWAAVRAGLAGRGLRAIPLTLTALCLIVLFQVAQQHKGYWGYGLVQDIGFVRAVDPWWLALLRLPLSLFVPAADLPVWGALVQVLLAFGIAEITLGRPRTLFIAYVCTLAGSLYARLGLAIGPGGALGLPADDALVVDTGPSGAVVGLTVFLCLRFRAWFTAALVVAAMLVEMVVKPNLAGKEHLVAIVVAVAVYMPSARRKR